MNQAGKMNCGAESINNFKFLIELSITQFSEFFNKFQIEKFTGFGGKFSLFEIMKKESGQP
jgi:hypothetical protein